MTDAAFAAWLRSGARRIVLIEARYIDPAVPGVPVAVYLSQGGYTTSPTDNPPNQPYRDLASAPQWQAKLADSLDGVAIPTWADIDVVNALGELDAWLKYSWDNQPLTIWVGGEGWPRADFRLTFSGVCQDIAPKDAATISLKIKDAQSLFNKPLTTRSLGEPELVAGLTYRISEGTPVTSIDAIEDDGRPAPFTANPALGQFTLQSPPIGRLMAYYTGGEATKGGPMPVALGRCFNVSPVLLNSGLHRYRLNGGPVQQIEAVRVDGNNAARTDNLQRGVIDMTAAPSGSVTADVRGDTVNGQWPATLGALIQHVLVDYAGATLAQIDSAGFAAFDAANAQVLGLYAKDQVNVLDVCDRLLKSLKAWVWPDRAGVFRLGRLTMPSGPAQWRITADDLDAGREITPVQRILPAKQLVLSYRPNHTVQTTLLPVVTESAAAAYRQPNRRTTPVVNPAASIWLGSAAKTVDTCLYDEADALAEARRQADLAFRLQEVWELPTIVPPLIYSLGDVVALDVGRYGLTGGVLGVVIGLSEPLAVNATTVQVWVPR